MTWLNELMVFFSELLSMGKRTTLWYLNGLKAFFKRKPNEHIRRQASEEPNIIDIDTKPTT